MTSRTVFQLLAVFSPLVGAVPGSLRPLILRQADSSNQQKPATPSMTPSTTSSSLPAYLSNTETNVWSQTTVANIASTMSTTLNVPSITGTSSGQTTQGLWPIICAYPHDSATTTAPDGQDSVSAEEKANRALAAWVMTEKITFTDGAVARSFKIPFVGSAGSVLAGVNLEGTCEPDQIIDPEWAKRIWSDIVKRCKGQDSSHFGGSERYRFNEHCAYNFVLYPGPLVTTVAPGTTRPAFGTGISGFASTLRPTTSQFSMRTAGASMQTPASASMTSPPTQSGGTITGPILSTYYGSTSAQLSSLTAELVSMLTVVPPERAVKVSSLATPSSTSSTASLPAQVPGQSLGAIACAYARPTNGTDYATQGWECVRDLIKPWSIGDKLQLTTEHRSSSFGFKGPAAFIIDMNITIGLDGMCTEGKYDIETKTTKLALLDLAQHCPGGSPYEVGGTESLVLTDSCNVIYQLHAGHWTAG